MEAQPQQKEIMMNFIDKLCDHLGNEKIKMLIDSGFDEWETVTYMKGQELVELGFSPEQCIVVMVSANANSREYQGNDIFSEEQMKGVIQKAKQQQQIRKEEVHNQQPQPKKNPEKEDIPFQVKKYPTKEITEVLLWKGTSMKPIKGQKLSAITMISLQEKGITHMTELDKLTSLQILHLSRNHIYKIESLENCGKIKTLKLEHNEICTIQGLQALPLLQNLTLSDNHISHVQGLANNRKLHIFEISNQIINSPMRFEEQSMQALSYSLERLQCSNNKINDISNFKYLNVIKQVDMKGNQLGDIGQISEALGAMQFLRSIDFRQNPLAKLPKYRDYIVILSKNLQQLDGKKILPSERQYLVKLYSLKHVNQMKGPGHKKSEPNSSKDLDLQGVKMRESHGAHQFYQGADLRGNVPYQNTKIGHKK